MGLLPFLAYAMMNF